MRLSKTRAGIIAGFSRKPSVFADQNDSRSACAFAGGVFNCALPRSDALSLSKKIRLLRAYVSGKPVFCTWQVTYACNFRCRFCDYWKEEVNYNPAARAREATLKDIRLASEKLATIGSLVISVAGGEPLLRRDIAEITAALAERHFPLMTTNGWLVTEERARELWDAGLCGISVSLDYGKGSTRADGTEQHDLQRGMPGAAERARRAIQILSRTRTHHRQQVNLICVLNDRNLRDVEELAKFAAENDATFSVQPYCSFKHGRQTLGSISQASQALIALKKRCANFRSTMRFLSNFDRFHGGSGIAGCKAGQAFFNIDNLLNVQKCVEFREEPVGNLRALTPEQVLVRLRTEHQRNSCTACWYSCRGEVESLYTVAGFLSALPTLFEH